VDGGLRLEDFFFFFLLPPFPIKRVVDDIDFLSLLLLKSSVDVKDGMGTEISREQEPDGWKAAAKGNMIV